MVRRTGRSGRSRAAQLRYAALDVELLPSSATAMAAALDEAGKTEIAAQEFTALLSFAPRERGEDEWRRTSGIHRIRKPRALAVVRALWLTRDEIAQRRDIAVGRILPEPRSPRRPRRPSRPWTTSPASRSSTAAVPSAT